MQLEPLGPILWIFYYVLNSHFVSFLFEGHVDKSVMFELLNSHPYMPGKIFLLPTRKLRLWWIKGRPCCVNHLGSWERWEKWRGMWWNQGTAILSPSFCSQPDPHPTVESNRHTKFKISANQSVIFPSLPHPVFCSSAPLQLCHAAQYPCHSSVVQTMISRCLHFEMLLSCEM